MTPSRPPFDPSVLPLYLAQISPASPVPFNPLSATSASELFPAAQHTLSIVREHVARAGTLLPERAPVVLPEYLLGIVDERPEQCLVASFFLDELKRLARDHQVSLCFTITEPRREGLAERLISPFVGGDDAASFGSAEREAWERSLTAFDRQNERIINVAYFLDAEGIVRGRYVKRNLWHPERNYLHPGTTHCEVFETPWGKAGMLICWDLSHSSAIAHLVDQGAKIVYAPTYWLSTDSDPVQLKYRPVPRRAYDMDLLPALCHTRAFEAECILTMVNPGASRSRSPSSSPLSASNLAVAASLAKQTPEAGFMGGSGVWAPLIGCAGQVGGGGNDRPEEEGWKVVEVPMACVEDGRKLYKIAEDHAKRREAELDQSEDGGIGA